MTWIWFALILLGLVAVCLTAIAAKSLREFPRHELEEACRRRDCVGRLDAILRLHEETALALESLRVVLVAALVTAGAYLGWPLAQAGFWATLAPAAVGGILALIAAVVWIPSAIVRVCSAPFLLRTWPLWNAVRRLVAPLTAAARFIDTVVHRLAGRTTVRPSEESFDEEIRSIVTEGHREGLLEETEREMIEGVIELADVDVSQIMTPRTDMVLLHADTPWEESLDLVVKSGHTRIPVFDKTRDDIVGVLHAKDLLRVLGGPPGQPKPPLRHVLREAQFVPETKPIDAILKEFQRTGNHLAIVLDEFGGVSGLVTIEDVLEEIVGEIIDEYDQQVVEDITPIDDATCEAIARAHIDEVNEFMGVDLPDEGDFDTIGGLVLSQLGRVPHAGESLTLDGVRITVLDASRRRIERVRVERLNGQNRDSA